MQTVPLHLGGKADKIDDRDQAYQPSIASVPPAADIRSLVASVYNQMPLQYSCSANALAAIFEMVLKIEKRTMAPPSRLFLYYNARVRDGSADKAEGVSIRDAIKAAADPGACGETLWPYDSANVCVKPSEAAYNGASEKIATYYRIDQNLDHMKACVAEGFPFLFGTQIFADQFTASQKSGVYDIPPAGTTAVGGHAMVAVGYDDASFTVLNSVGDTWGKNGFISMPYAYFTNPQWTYDFWTIRSLR